MLTDNATVISRTSVQGVSKNEHNVQDVKDMLHHYDSNINEKIGNDIRSNGLPPPQPNKRYIFDEDDEIDVPFQKDFIKDYDDNISNTNYDKLLTAEISFMVDEQIKLGKVTGYKRDGNVMGKHNVNALLNISLYEVTFLDGTMQNYTANKIAEAICEQVDKEGNKYLLLESFIDRKCDGTKASQPLQVAEYAILKGIDSELAFHKCDGWKMGIN